MEQSLAKVAPFLRGLSGPKGVWPSAIGAARKGTSAGPAHSTLKVRMEQRRETRKEESERARKVGCLRQGESLTVTMHRSRLISEEEKRHG